jgi:hypothetical protein
MGWMVELTARDASTNFSYTALGIRNKFTPSESDHLPATRSLKIFVNPSAA